MDIPTVLAERYITVNVQLYPSAPVPIDPTFVNDVQLLLGGWVVGKGLDAALAYLDKRLGSPAYRARAQREERSPFVPSHHATVSHFLEPEFGHAKLLRAPRGLRTAAVRGRLRVRRHG